MPNKEVRRREGEIFVGKKAKRFRRVFAAALALWLMVPAHAIAVETIDEVKARQEELQAENEVLEAKLADLKADEKKLLEYQAALEEKIQLTETKIDTARESIRLMDREIAALEKKLDASRQEHEETIALFSQRIKALYKAGNVGTLEILLNSSSFSDFTMRAELLSSVTRHDQQLLDKIEEYLKKTRQDRENLQAMREQEGEIKKELEADQEELRGLYLENSEVIASLEEKQAITKDTIAANEEEDAALEEQLQELIRQKNEEEQRRKEQGIIGDPPSPGMHEDFSPWWPLPGVGIDHVIGRFGDVYDFDDGPHKGTDIWADYGEPIVAAQAGQVLSAEYHYSWGNNVLIWHNETFATRYAHCSSLIVSAGEYVEQGQTIGYVGSTGFSTGNHLHFEVYYDGTRVAAEPYLGI